MQKLIFSVVTIAAAVGGSGSAVAQPNPSIAALERQIDEAIAAMPLRFSTYLAERAAVSSSRTTECKTFVRLADAERHFNWAIPYGSPNLFLDPRGTSVGGPVEDIGGPGGLYFNDPAVPWAEQRPRMELLYQLLLRYWRHCAPPPR